MSNKTLFDESSENPFRLIDENLPRVELAETFIRVLPEPTWEKLISFCMSKGLTIEDAEDVLLKAWMELYEDILDSKFTHENEQATMSYIYRKLGWRAESLRKKREKDDEKEISLQQLLVLPDGRSVEFGDILIADSIDLDFVERRAKFLELAEQCIPNEEHLELVKWRIGLGEFNEEWGTSFIHTTWHRALKRIADYARMNGLKINQKIKR